MITGVVLARNEERNITECLKNLRPHVEDLILIDMESTDRTIELAQQLLDQLLHHPLVANFDAARNIAIPKARHDWLWFVDADERVSEHTGRTVREIVLKNGNDFEAITIPFKSYFCGKWIEHCGWWPGYTMPRVLKRGYFRFAEKLHGGVELTGRSIKLAPDPAIGVDHYSYSSIEHYLEKLNRYTTTEAQQMQKVSKGYQWKEAIRHMAFDLWQYYELNEGHKDGLHGWILSWLSGQYRWLSHAKLIDGCETSLLMESTEYPADLNAAFDCLNDSLAEFRASSPKLPLGIVWRGPIWDPSGYADESRTFIKSLSQGDRELRIDDIHWASAECTIPASDRALYKALMRATRPAHSASITNCIPTLVAPVATSSLTYFGRHLKLTEYLRRG